MHLRHEESVIRVIRRHRTPYLLRMLGIFILCFPIYFLLSLLYSIIGLAWLIGVYAVLSFFVGIIIGIISLDYLLDKLILTSRRLISVNWKSLFYREEHETELLDIQDVATKERGILSKFPWFNFGTLIIETAASKTAITFPDCPNPEEIEHFIVVQTEKLRKATPTP